MDLKEILMTLMTMTKSILMMSILFLKMKFRQTVIQTMSNIKCVMFLND